MRAEVAEPRGPIQGSGLERPAPACAGTAGENQGGEARGESDHANVNPLHQKITPFVLGSLGLRYCRGAPAPLGVSTYRVCVGLPYWI